MTSRNFKVDPVNPPTEKQLSFATKIAAEVGRHLPAVKTRQSMFLFIRDNIDEYRSRIPKRNLPTADDLSFDDFGDANGHDAWDFLWCAGYDPYTGGIGD